MRTFVSFESDFSHEGEEGRPPGLELAQYLYQGLRKAGFQINDPQNREDWAWDFILDKNDYQIETVVGYVNDSPIQWLITTYVHVSFWKKLFMSSVKMQAESELKSYCQVIHGLLSGGEFRAVRWYEQIDFDQNATDKWAASP
jgi:hypothetical protein